MDEFFSESLRSSSESSSAGFSYLEIVFLIILLSVEILMSAGLTVFAVYALIKTTNEKGRKEDQEVNRPLMGDPRVNNPMVCSLNITSFLNMFYCLNRAMKRSSLGSIGSLFSSSLMLFQVC